METYMTTKKKHGLKWNKNNFTKRSKLLLEFEIKLFSMINNIKFNKHTNDLQPKMRRDIDKIKKPDSGFIRFDNYLLYQCRIIPSIQKFLNSIKKRMTPGKNLLSIMPKPIVTELKIDDRIGKLRKQQAFVIIKYDKENFLNNPQSLNC